MMMESIGKLEGLWIWFDCFLFTFSGSCYRDRLFSLSISHTHTHTHPNGVNEWTVERRRSPIPKGMNEVCRCVCVCVCVCVWSVRVSVLQRGHTHWCSGSRSFAQVNDEPATAAIATKWYNYIVITNATFIALWLHDNTTTRELSGL